MSEGGFRLVVSGSSTTSLPHFQKAVLVVIFVQLISCVGLSPSNRGPRASSGPQQFIADFQVRADCKQVEDAETQVGCERPGPYGMCRGAEVPNNKAYVIGCGRLLAYKRLCEGDGVCEFVIAEYPSKEFLERPRTDRAYKALSSLEMDLSLADNYKDNESAYRWATRNLHRGQLIVDDSERDGVERIRWKRQQEERQKLEEQDARDKADEQKRLEDLRAVPLQHADLRISNSYAESLITVVVHAARTDETFVAVENRRIAGGDTVLISRVLRGRVGHPVSIAVSSVSLGKKHRLGAIDAEIVEGKTLHIVYDWDNALAQFRVRYNWE